MSRFFVDPNCIRDGRAVIRGEDANHITRVLRMRPGDALTVCDGACTDYAAQIETMNAEAVTVLLGASARCTAEPAYTVTLLQGLPKAGKLETVIQKCVELGVTEIIPIAAARSVVRMTKADFEKKRPRYQKVAAEAAKQSGRGILPAVGALNTYAGVDYTAFDLLLVAYEEEREQTLKAALRGLHGDAPLRIALVIGPEGGLAAEEVRHMRAHGGLTVSLGRRILRTETAGMAMLAMLQYELDG